MNVPAETHISNANEFKTLICALIADNTITRLKEFGNTPIFDRNIAILEQIKNFDIPKTLDIEELTQTNSVQRPRKGHIYNYNSMASNLLKSCYIFALKQHLDAEFFYKHINTIKLCIECDICHHTVPTECIKTLDVIAQQPKANNVVCIIERIKQKEAFASHITSELNNGDEFCSVI